jgi:Cohesin domain
MKNVQNDLNEFNQLHPNRKLAIFGIILFVFVLSIVVGVYFSKKSARMNAGTESPLPTSATAETTALALVPSAETVKVGETVTVSVMLSGEAVQATDIFVNFDPAVFKATAINNGEVYESLIRQTMEKDHVSITAGLNPSATDNMKTGEVFSFTLEAIAKGSSELAFDPELTITAKNGLNSLKGTQNVTVSVE